MSKILGHANIKCLTLRRDRLIVSGGQMQDTINRSLRSSFCRERPVVSKSYSSEIADKLAHGANSMWSDGKQATGISRCNIRRIYLSAGVLLYAFGIILISQGLLYLTLLVMSCGGACFLLGLRQAREHRIKLKQDAQQKVEAYRSLYAEPSYPGKPGSIVEGYKTDNDIQSIGEHVEPLLIFQINEKITRNDLQGYIIGWEQRLARKEPFGVLIVQYDEVSQADQEIIKLGLQWHHTHKSHTGRYCVGVAVVTTSTRMITRLASRSILARAMRIWLGCPGQICTTEAEAKAWLTRQLNQSQKILKPEGSLYNI